MIKWRVDNLRRLTDTGYVIEVSYRCMASYGGKAAIHTGIERYDFNMDEQNFIPYDQLTEEVVLGWVFSEIPKQYIEATLRSMVDAQLQPITENGLPWSQE